MGEGGGQFPILNLKDEKIQIIPQLIFNLKVSFL